MPSARRRAFAARKLQKSKEKKPLLPKFIIPILILAATFLFIKLTQHYWNGKDKVALLFRQENGDIGISVLDPRLSEITTLNIPGDTQVDVARNYGSLRIKNVWQLGENEKIGGRLLTETVTKNFLFPVILWQDGAPGLDTGILKDLVRFVFLPGKGNTSIGDRIEMAVFSLGVSELEKTRIDLGESQYLTKKTLKDGLSGYELAGPISQRLTIFFSDNQIGDQDLKVNITDATGSFGVAEKLGEIIQVIGGKIVSIDKVVTPDDSDCEVSGINEIAVKKIADLFSCTDIKAATTFDLNIRIGSEFAERF